MVQFTHVTISRNGEATIATLKFFFDFILPSPQKARLITQRDEFGKIVNSRVPDIVMPTQNVPYGTKLLENVS